MTTTRYRLTALVLTGILVAILAACGTDTVVKYAGDVDSPPEVHFGPEDTGHWEGDVYIPSKPDGYKPDGQRYMIILKHDTSVPYNLYVDEKKAIMAQVIDFEEGIPAINYPVKFTVVGANPECDSGHPDCGYFEVKEGMTDALGNVSVTFHAGPVGNILYSIELSGAQAEPTGMDLLVSDLPVGNLKVKLLYDGPVAI